MTRFDATSYLSRKNGDRSDVRAGAAALPAAADVHAGRDEHMQGGHVGERRLAALPDPPHHSQRRQNLNPVRKRSDAPGSNSIAKIFA